MPISTSRFDSDENFVEEGPDPLHAAGDGRTVDPDLVRPEDAPASGGELIEDLALLG
jgi:hypothetical protein